MAPDGLSSSSGTLRLACYIIMVLAKTKTQCRGTKGVRLCIPGFGVSILVGYLLFFGDYGIVNFG